MNAIVKFEDLVSVDRRVITTTTLKIAESLGLQHKNVISLVRHYQSDFEEFGLLAFETRPFSTRGGKQHREIAILNEQHATLLISYWKNTEKVRHLKKALVRAFFEAKAMLNSGYLDLVEQRGVLTGMFGAEFGKASHAGYTLNAWKYIRDDLQTAIARVDSLIQPCLNFDE